MANRTRKNSIQFYVTDDELALISERMKEAGISNRGEYMRRMAIDGLILYNKSWHSNLKDFVI